MGFSIEIPRSAYLFWQNTKRFSNKSSTLRKEVCTKHCDHLFNVFDSCVNVAGESANIVGARFLWDSLLVAGRDLQPFYVEYKIQREKLETNAPTRAPQTQARAPKETLDRQGQAKDADLARKTEDMVRAMAQKILGHPTSSDDALMTAGMDSLGKTHFCRSWEMLARFRYVPKTHA